MCAIVASEETNGMRLISPEWLISFWCFSELIIAMTLYSFERFIVCDIVFRSPTLNIESENFLQSKNSYPVLLSWCFWRLFDASNRPQPKKCWESLKDFLRQRTIFIVQIVSKHFSLVLSSADCIPPRNKCAQFKRDNYGIIVKWCQSSAVACSGALRQKHTRSRHRQTNEGGWWNVLHFVVAFLLIRLLSSDKLARNIQSVKTARDCKLLFIDHDDTAGAMGRR